MYIAVNKRNLWKIAFKQRGAFPLHFLKQSHCRWCKFQGHIFLFVATSKNTKRSKVIYQKIIYYFVYFCTSPRTLKKSSTNIVFLIYISNKIASSWKTGRQRDFKQYIFRESLISIVCTSIYSLYFILYSTVQYIYFRSLITYWNLI
jgi:hypothetical protein